jgi:hypothetical protein
VTNNTTTSYQHRTHRASPTTNKLSAIRFHHPLSSAVFYGAWRHQNSTSPASRVPLWRHEWGPPASTVAFSRLSFSISIIVFGHISNKRGDHHDESLYHASRLNESHYLSTFYLFISFPSLFLFFILFSCMVTVQDFLAIESSTRLWRRSLSVFFPSSSGVPFRVHCMIGHLQWHLA